MTLVIAAAQSASVPGDIAENLSRHLQVCAIAAERGVGLLVFPELSLTGYEPTLARSRAIRPHGSCLRPLRHLAERSHMTVVVGAPVLDYKGQLHIAALAICPDGSVSTYTKKHLHPGEEEVFAPGTGGPTLSIGGATVAFAICADTTHPQHPAGAAARGANIYAAGVLITENGYSRDTAQLRHYAREHRMAVVMANHSAPTGGWVPAGRSAIWSEDGHIVAASRGTEEALVVGRRRRGSWDGVVLPAPAVSTAAASQG
ncbi:MAG: carbon-nitrogen hydrolase family protein [Bryobacteraceae bacterium]